MRSLTEAQALAVLQRAKARYQTEIKLGYEHRAMSCRNCPTPGVCCTDAHFVNNHITRLEAIAMRETLHRTPRLDDAGRRRVYERARASVARYNLSTAGDTFKQTYSCPLFEPGAGCLVHNRAKPAPCIQHACYADWMDVPPAGPQWQTESRVERLNTQVYSAAWAWLPVPVWLTLVDPEADGRELEQLARAWSARHPNAAREHNSRARLSQKRRALPVLQTVR